MPIVFIQLLIILSACHRTLRGLPEQSAYQLLDDGMDDLFYAGVDL